jgi:galactokinase
LIESIVASAPGRVNLIGEHTDYNGGWVLPMALPLRTTVELTVRDDDVVRVSSGAVHGPDHPPYTLGAEKPAHDWLDYVEGVTVMLRAAGYALRGFDARIRSNVPIGKGLSSSAALEVAMLRALRSAFDLGMDDVTLALIAQRAENDFVGAPVGVMDQLASSLGDDHTAVLIDTRSLAIERIPLPRDVEIAVIDSGVAHSNVSGGYRERRAECAEAAERLGVAQLRDIDDVARLEMLPEPLRRRARHVVTEDARVLEAAAAMRDGDAATLGRLFVQSHASMRDDFEVSVPEVDALVTRALDEVSVFGARLTGGGFGGSVVVLVRKGEARATAERIAAAVRGAEVVLPEAK